MYTRWLSAIPLSNLVAYIPVIATVVTSFFSIVLARATLRYVEATDKGLALAREEFEREWSPELHIKLERVSGSEARMVVTNLAKISVLLQMIQLRRLTHVMPAERWFLNDPLAGGLSWKEDASKRLLACVGEDFQGEVAISMTFYASGRMFRTDWFRFRVEVRADRIVHIDPSNIPARPFGSPEPEPGAQECCWDRYERCGRRALQRGNETNRCGTCALRRRTS